MLLSQAMLFMEFLCTEVGFGGFRLEDGGSVPQLCKALPTAGILTLQ